MKQWPLRRLGDLFSVEKGRIGIKAATPGRYPLVTTGEKHQTHSVAHFIGDAVCIPMVSATGHGHASIKRLHHVQGEFAVGSILCACVSNNADRVSARYAYYYLSACKDNVLIPLMQGSANVSLKLADIASIEIPLPPLPEQQAIVTHLDALANKSRQLAEHLAAIEADASDLVRAYLFGKPARSYPRKPMSELVHLRSPNVVVDRTQFYRFAGVYSFGRGVFASVSKVGDAFAYDRLSTIRTGDFIYPKLMAWEGALGVVPPECDNRVVSPEFPVFSVDAQAVLPEILDIYFRTPAVWPELAALSGGTNVRRRRLQPSAFLRYEIPVPPLSIQQKVRELHQRVTALRASNMSVREANAALLPATLERLFG